MKTGLILATVATLYATSSTIEYNSIIDLQRARFEACVQAGASFVFTDSEINDLISRCEEESGYPGGE